MFIDNLENLTVDQLLEKQIEIKRKIMQASSSRMSAQIIGQMQAMLDTINIEIQTKIQKESFEQEKQKITDSDKNYDGVALSIGDIE
jgi:hypothetical protein